MTTQTSVARQQDTFSNWITGAGVKSKIAAMVSGVRGEQLVTAIVTAVNQNAQLGQCERGSILSAALTGAALNLSASPSLGHFYMVPYGGKAQFQLGYKGMIQLAMRSGDYFSINAMELREGELRAWNPLTEEIDVEMVTDATVRDALPIIGYLARFKLLNGFTKTIYWSREKVVAHAKRFSKSFAKKDSPWQEHFDAMAKKTVMRDLLGRWGVMSIQMERAHTADMAIVRDDGSFDYIDMQDGSTDSIAGAAALPECTPEKFEEELHKWAEVVLSGKKTPEQIADMVGTKYALTEEQRARIMKLQTGE
ncbi:MAG: recombinase RecT [Azoarcus sp.]|jgi:recombination protein RecT|nr:recombinase RecT [Azoarcus sp.]